MHFSTTALASALLTLPLLTSALFPISEATLPGCAKSCSVNLPANCLGDPLCICSNTAWMNQVYCCGESRCNSIELGISKTFAATICSVVGQQIMQPASCPAHAGAPAATLGATMPVTNATAAKDIAAVNNVVTTAKPQATPAPAGGNTVANRIKVLEGGLFGRKFKA